MKFVEKCARRDWPERVHYNSIKDRALRHTSALRRVLTHAATSSVRARAFHDAFYKRNKKLVP